MSRFRRWCVAMVAMGSCLGGVAAGGVSVLAGQDGFVLHDGGEVFKVKGVGGSHDMEALAAIGGNAVRTWGAEELDQFRTGSDGVRRPYLDHAQHLGIRVCAGFWMEHPRHGFSYEDEAAAEAQLEELEAFVRAHKDHEAVMMWGIGNEVELGTDVAKVLPHLNEAARRVKAIDRNRPTMVVIAEIGDDKARLFRELCPDVDILGINSYGGMASLRERLDKQGYTGPYLVTEYGLPGHWETGASAWGAPWEPSSAEKAAFLRRNYEATINGDGRCLGGFAFLWGWKQERTATWYGMWLESGEAVASVDVLHELWTGKARENRAPSVSGPRLNVPIDAVPPGASVEARVDLSDPDGDALTVTWIVRAESTDHRMGGDAEARPEELERLTVTTENGRAMVRTPEKPGAYRLFVYVRDGRGNAATSNTPFQVVPATP